MRGAWSLTALAASGVAAADEYAWSPNSQYWQQKASTSQPAWDHPSSPATWGQSAASSWLPTAHEGIPAASTSTPSASISGTVSSAYTSHSIAVVSYASSAITVESVPAVSSSPDNALLPSASSPLLLTTVTDAAEIYSTVISGGSTTYLSKYHTMTLTKYLPMTSNTYAKEVPSSSYAWSSSSPSSSTATPSSSGSAQIWSSDEYSASGSVSWSTTVVYAAATETQYSTIDVTVTSCSPGVEGCPATSSDCTISSFSVGSEVLTSIAPVTTSASHKAWTTESPKYPTTSSKAASSGWPTSGKTASSTQSSGCALPTSPLSNAEQVGNSTWGTLCQPTYPKWLDGPNGQKYATAPWGDKNTKNSDATVRSDVPNTGVTRYYDFTIARGRISVDGVLRDVILVNDQYPGPNIEANWGDMIQVTVHNKIENPMEGTSLHWHGMLQRDSQWEDGVPSISQCPIAPGHSFTYLFQAEIYGSSWYHAHYSAQYTGGAVGPMVVYGPSQLDYDIDIGPVMLTDWYHVPYFSIVADAVGTDLSLIPPTSDNILINGRSNFDCSKPSYSNSTEWLGSNLKSNISWTCVDNAEISKFQFQSGKTHRLRLINHGADGTHKFSIDGHTMKVIALDYVPVVPYETGLVTLGVGQRVDVLVTANNNTAGAYYMRTSAPGGAACGGSTSPQALAAIYYEGADTSVLPTTSSAYNSTDCLSDDLSLTSPEFSITPSANPYQQDLELALVMNATGNYEWQVNNQTFRANFNEPLLFKAAAGNVSYPYDPQWNVYNFANNNSVLLNVTNGTPFGHPFHLHGHNFYVLNAGTGVWDGTVVGGSNPLRRDMQMIPASGYAVFQFEADNPGVWPFHCHVAWHLSGGLAINIVSRPGDIGPVPDVKPQTCTDWDWYSNHNVVDQIDAGS